MNKTNQIDSGLSNLSREEVVDLIQSSPEQALKSTSILAGLASDEYNYIIDTFEKLTNKDIILKQIKDIFSIPAQIKFRIYPHSNYQEVLSKNVIAGAILEVPNKRLESWKGLSEDPEFFVEVTGNIDEESLIRYRLSESDLREVPTTANRSSKIMTAILAGTLILGLGLKSSVLENLTKNVKNVFHTQAESIPERTFLSSYPLVWKELSKLEDSAKYLANLNALSNADIEAILKMNGFGELADTGMSTEAEKLTHIEHELDLYIKDSALKSKYAKLIYDQAAKIGIDYRIMTSIIRTESKFDQKAVSRTGDISLVQINPGTWDHAEWLRIRGYNKKQVDSMLVKIKENPALGKEIFDLERLPKDSAYAIERFGEILSYLKKTYSKNDKFWYARYHSSTCNEIKCPKLDYAKTVNSYYKEMNTHLEKEFKNKLAQISSDIKELKTNPNINIAVLEAFESELKMLNKVKHVGKNRMVAQN